MKYSVVLSFLLYCFCSLQTANGQQQPDAGKDTLNYCKEGDRLLQGYQFEKAIEPLQLCYNADSQNVDCLEKIAYCNYQLGRLKTAKSNYLSVVEKDTAHISALNQLGGIYNKEGRYQKSLSQYLKLIALDSTNSYYYKQAAGLLMKQQQFEQAIAYYQKSLQLNPHDITVFAELGSIYENLNILSVADSLIAKGLQLDSANIRLLMSRTRLEYKTKNYRGVVAGIHQILHLQADTTAYMMKMLGISFFHVQEYEKSIFLLNKIVEMEKESEFTHYYLGLAYRSAGDLGKSAFHFEQAVQSGISENISIYYTNLGIAYEEQGNFGESIKAYQAAYKSSRDHKLLYHLARNYDTYYSEKKTALLYYEKFLAQNDTGNVQLKDYSKHRINELKEIVHFNIDTLE